MRYNRLENAGIDISALTVGTWAIGGTTVSGRSWGKVDKNESIKAIQAMIANGVNCIDTAPIYGSGNSEIVVGEAIKHCRDKVILATKFGSFESAYKNRAIRDSRYDTVIRNCEESLQRLGTDYLDIYIQHWPDPDTPIEETMAALNKLKEDGKIRFIGVSNYTQDMMEEAMRYARIDVMQKPFSMVNQTERKLMEWAAQHGIGVMSYGSLGAGILTGTIRELPNFDEKDSRMTFYDFYREPKFSKIMELLKTMDKISIERNKPLAQIAVNWSTQQNFISTSMVGVRNEAEANENCAAYSWSLTDDEIKLLDRELERLGLVE